MPGKRPYNGIENQYFFRIKTRHKDVGYKLANKEAGKAIDHEV